MSEEQRKTPSAASTAVFVKYVSSKRNVISIEKSDSQVFEIAREGMADLRVFLTNVYIVGEADLYEIASSHKNLDAIVTMSAWNSYTKGAKKSAKREGVGLFRFQEFMGAIYYDGKKFLDYIHPDDRK